MNTKGTKRPSLTRTNRPEHSIRQLTASLTLVLLAASCPVTMVSADGPSVALEGPIEITEEGATVAVHLHNFTDLFAATVVLTYPNQVVEVVDVSFGDMPLAHYGPVEKPAVNRTEGTVTQSLWIPATYSFADHVVFTVTFQPVQRNLADTITCFNFSVGEDTVFYSPDGGTRILPDTSRVTATPATVLASATPSDGHVILTDNELLDTTGNSDEEQYANLPILPSEDGTNTDTPQAILTVNSMTVGLSDVLPNQQVDITASICNTGDRLVTETVSLTIGGEVDQTQVVSVATGACEDLRFFVTRAAPGIYQVAIDGLTGQFTVLPTDATPPPPGSEVVPPSAQNGIGMPVILAIVGMMLLLIATLVFFFRRA